MTDEPQEGSNGKLPPFRGLRHARRVVEPTLGLVERARRKVHRFKYNEPLAATYMTLLDKPYRTTGLEFDYPRDQVGYLQRSRFFYDVYEWEERELVGRHLRPDDRVLELGACIGVVSCTIDQVLTGPGAGLVAVEPNPDLYDYLDRNRRRNDCGFVIERCAISDDDEVEFYVDSLMTRGRLGESVDSTTVTVPGRSLDDLQADHGRFSAMVMDIQGTEQHVLTGDLGSLADLRLLVVEWHPQEIGPDAVEECRANLLANGFSPVESLSDVEVWHRETR